MGELVDRLSILNIKIYSVQDKIYGYSADSLDVFKGRDQAEVHANLKKLASLNLERNETMRAIDQCLADAVKSGTAKVDERIKITG